MWTKTGAAPPELLTYTLCTQMYHCRPSELREERLVDVLPHLTVSNVIIDIQQAEARSMAGKRR